MGTLRSSAARVAIGLYFVSHGAVAQTTSKVNVSSTGYTSFDASAFQFTEDGRWVAFETLDPNFMPGISNGLSQVYVHDRPTGATEIVSIDASGVAADRSCSVYGLSSDGRYVVFNSASTNLVPGTSNGSDQIYVRDRATGTTDCASLDPNGAPADASCSGGPISDDGRYVVFMTDASNIVQPDSQGQMDVFVRDRSTGTTVRASVNSEGREANGWSVGYSLSADGSLVVFESYATNLVPGDTNGVEDAFVRNLRTGTTERVSVATDGSQGNGLSESPALSSDGRFVLFESLATNLVPGDTNGKLDVFLRDLRAGTTTRVSLTSTGGQCPGYVESGGISADGRFVLLDTDSPDMIPGDLNSRSDCFLLDRQTGELELVSLAFDGAQGDEGSWGSRVSTDGRFVAFYSEAFNLIPDAADSFGGIFVRDRGPTVEAFCFGDGTGSPCPCSNDGSRGRGCDNSERTGGAELRPSGRSSLGRDSLVLATEGVRSNTPCVLIQASFAADPRAYGDGLLCLAGRPTRLFVENAVGNVVRAPRIGDTPVSARSAAQGALILPGSSRFYQTYYRDTNASFCPPPARNDWNISNGLAIVWDY